MNTTKQLLKSLAWMMNNKPNKTLERFRRWESRVEHYRKTIAMGKRNGNKK